MKDYLLPKRLQGLQPTLIRQIFDRALPGSINFGLGEPDLPTPAAIKEEAARVIADETNGYTSHAGLPALRQKIIENYPKLDLALENVVVTVGSNEAMFLSLMVLAQAGDEVLMPDPGFPAYPAICSITGATPVYYRLPADRNFEFDIEDFRRRITERTKVVVLISPSNPTGKTLLEADLQMIAEALRDTNAFVISDEIYSELYFGDAPPASISDFYERTLIISGLSKSMSMTGWRLGWLASQSKEVMRAALVLHGFVTVCASTVSQKAALAAWSDEARADVARAREIYRKRRDFLIETIRRELNLQTIAPDGAFYTMVDVREYGDDVKLAERLLEHKVITVPGVAFGEESKGFLRISFCSDEAAMTEGIRRIKEGLGNKV